MSLISVVVHKIYSPVRKTFIQKDSQVPPVTASCSGRVGHFTYVYFMVEVHLLVFPPLLSLEGPLLILAGGGGWGGKGTCGRGGRERRELVSW